MIVRRLRMVGFASYAEAVDVHLPERGLVVLTGPNGAGKSSLVEAVAAACWGKSLRGSAMWRDGEQAAVLLDSDLATVYRRRSPAGKTALRWQLADPADMAIARLSDDGSLGEDDEYASAAKAQAGLDRVVGGFDVWRRTSVLSSADAAHFALATDAERKALLESVLGLDRFDAALTACRAERREAEAATARLDRDVDVAAASLEGARAALAQATEALHNAPEPAPLEEIEDRLGRLAAARAQSRSIIRVADDRLAQATEALRRLQADVRQAEMEAERHAAGACPRCGQDVRHLHAVASRRLDDARASAEAQRAEAERDMTAAAAQLGELQEEEDDLRHAEAAASAELRQRQGAVTQHDAARRAYDAAARKLDEWTVRHGAAHAARARHADEAAELELCERVLGLRGVRATMLDGALRAVGQRANAWLRRLAFAGSVRLTSTTTQASGRVVDAISLEVEGAGGGRYRGASAGERRRVDLSVLFGLMEVAQAARGGRTSTLWIDEAADSLDAEGRAAFAEAMAELAQSRPVVLVTHDAELAARLPAALRLHVEAGTVVRV